MKNRTADPEHPRHLTFDQILQLPMPDGLTRRKRATWPEDAKAAIETHERRAVSLDGFLFDAKKEGPESPNCHDDDDRQKDFHLWLVEHEGDDRTKAVVVEITPRLRDKHDDWTLAMFRRLAKDKVRVRITGWLMFDQEHPEQLHASGSHGATRGTLWEIHPITKVETR